MRLRHPVQSYWPYAYSCIFLHIHQQINPLLIALFPLRSPSFSPFTTLQTQTGLRWGTILLAPYIFLHIHKTIPVLKPTLSPFALLRTRTGLLWDTILLALCIYFCTSTKKILSSSNFFSTHSFERKQGLVDCLICPVRILAYSQKKTLSSSYFFFWLISLRARTGIHGCVHRDTWVCTQGYMGVYTGPIR